ncbi:MAG: N-carbamoylputrescine amidase [Myxococcales bacterium]|nr:N-carbamoylputrescine amidase [Myxococcales bacterium]MBK7195028.1 N-carbamoylputrescine amidase [Myxococcales bacterium]MBP6842450.1 N-carbamoylputrescine amidase [Kofleriaceae bacterium]
MSRTVTVAALQCALTDDVATNVARVSELIRAAAARGAQIVLPSELFEGHYFCRQQREDDFLRARPAAAHPTIAAMAALARELGVVIPVSFFEQDGPEYYNSVAVLDADGGHLGTYRKSHIPDGPGYQEKFFFKPGNTGFMAFATRYATIGVGICWDQWFPECARAMALAGADLLFYPTAIGTEPEEPDFDSKDSWQRVMIGHAIANQVGVIASNRVGVEGDAATGGAITFHGSSFVCDHRGDKLAELDRTEAGVALATFDLDRLQRARASMGFFRDRRPELYGRLVK